MTTEAEIYPLGPKMAKGVYMKLQNQMHFDIKSSISPFCGTINDIKRLMLFSVMVT